jgi:hypothetical protein
VVQLPSVQTARVTGWCFFEQLTIRQFSMNESFAGIMRQVRHCRWLKTSARFVETRANPPLEPIARSPLNEIFC